MAVVLSKLRAVSRNERYFLKKVIKMAYLHYWQNKNTQKKTGVTTLQIYWFYYFTFPG